MADSSNGGPRLLKADQLPGAVGPVGRILQFQDLRDKHDRLLSDARNEAEAVLEAARVEAELVRQQAFETARQDGREQAAGDLESEIEQRASQLVEERFGEQLSRFVAVTSQLQELDKTQLGRWQNTATELAIAIAGKLVRRQLDVRPENAAEMIATALQFSAGSRRVEVRLHPEDLEMLNGDQALAVSSGLAVLPEGLLVADGTLERGDCLVQTVDGRVDARLETLLGRITTELLDVDDAS
jgi:flagellar assembly protein FliH